MAPLLRSIIATSLIDYKLKLHCYPSPLPAFKTVFVSHVIILYNKRRVESKHRHHSILLVGHNGINKALIADITGQKLRDMQDLENTSICIFDLDENEEDKALLSDSKENLWEYELPDGRGMRLAIEFLFPYIVDKSTWPYPPDVQHFEEWPVAMPGFLFAGIALDKPDYVSLWKPLDKHPDNIEVQRNIAIKEPILWLHHLELFN